MNTISNIPADIEWRVYKGDTAVLSVAVKDDSCKDYDLTDYTVSGMIKADPTDEEELQTLTVTISNNIIQINIDDTATLPKSSYFDIQLVKDTTIWTILKGMIITENDITR